MNFYYLVAYRFKFLIPLFLLLSVNLYGQRDSIFWFAAPEVAQGAINYDRPAVFRVSTYDEDVTVRLSQPANPLFTPRQIFIPAGQTGTFSFPPDFAFVENITPNSALNFGFLIESSSAVTAYYEVIGDCECNPEIFSLKGANALGTSFFVPFQEFLPNSRQANHTPAPSADFCIVATEDNTQVTINPTADIFGHVANSSFTITLNRGQTWVGKTSSHLANRRPSGTSVVSDKNIAITMKDDLLNADGIYFGGCRDLLGDQIVPISSLGNDYIVQRGSLVGPERAFILAVADNTSINISGVGAINLNRGQRYELVVNSPIYFIESNNPIYVLQVTGVGCEVSAAILPSYECRGTDLVRFVRPTNEPLYLFLVTNIGLENSFLVNEQAGVINSNDFNIVPGTNGEILAAKILVNSTVVPTGISTSVRNPDGVFQLGILCGRENVTGTRYAYFSDFGGFQRKFEIDSICNGESLNFYGQTITAPGIYLDTTELDNGCSLISELTVTSKNYTTAFEERSVCEGDSIYIGNEWVFEEGIYADTITSSSNCDTLLFLDVIFQGAVEEEIFLEACENQVLTVNGQVYSESTSFVDTIATSDGCDIIRTYTLDFFPLNRLNVDSPICEGDSVLIGNSYVYESGVYLDTIDGGFSCDTVVTNNVYYVDATEIEVEIFGCKGQTINFREYEYTESGVDEVFVNSISDCDTLFLVEITFYDLEEEIFTYEACEGDIVNIGDRDFTASETFIDTVYNEMDPCPKIEIHNIIFSNLQILAQDSIFSVNYGDTLTIDPNISSLFDFSFTWDPITDNIDPLSLFQIIQVIQDQFLTLNVVDLIGCRQTVDYSILVLLPECDEFLFIPSGLSPNGDGINDKLGLFTKPECVSEIQWINIFNRWGDLIYGEEFPILNNDEVGWDGTFKGQSLNPDVFVYTAMVTLYDGSIKFVSGEITLYK